MSYKKKTGVQSLALLLIISLLCIGLQPVVTWGEELKKMSFRLSAATLKTNEVGSVIISATEIPDPGLAGYRLRITYDPQVVEILNIDRAGAFSAPTYTIDQDRGYAVVVSAQAKGISGEAALAAIQIKALSTTNATAELKLEALELVSESLTELSAINAVGQISITGTGTPPGAPSSPSSPGQVQGQNPIQDPLYLQNPIRNSAQKVRAGNNRFETSEVIALAHFPAGSTKNIVVANGYASADALAGAPLAYKMKAPIILAPKLRQEATALTNYLTKSELKDGKLILLGGQGVLNQEYEKADPNLVQKTRLGGSNRRATAVLIAKELVGDNVGTPVVVVNENSFVDAISIAPIAAQNGWPILLTEKGRLSKETADYLKEVKPDSVYVIGGQGVISDQVENELVNTYSRVNRIGGTNRFKTNALILKSFVSEAEVVAFANGDSSDVVDALAGAGLGIPIVLVEKKNNLKESQVEWLNSVVPVSSEIYGGSGVIAPNISW